MVSRQLNCEEWEARRCVSFDDSGRGRAKDNESTTYDRVHEEVDEVQAAVAVGDLERSVELVAHRVLAVLAGGRVVRVAEVPAGLRDVRAHPLFARLVARRLDRAVLAVEALCMGESKRGSGWCAQARSRGHRRTHRDREVVELVGDETRDEPGHRVLQSSQCRGQRE